MNYMLDTIDSKVAFLREIVSRSDAYAKQSKSGRYVKIDGEVTDELLYAHVNGDITIGAYQLHNGFINWICYDLDTHGNEDSRRTQVELLILSSRLDELKIPYYLELSGSPHSYHLWIFITDIDVSIAHKFSRDIVIGLGLTCEIFPKQNNAEKPYGNLVKLPLGINQKNGNRSQFVDDGIEFNRIDLLYTRLPKFKERAVKEHTQCTKSEQTPQQLPSNIRPCMSNVIDNNLQMTGGDGHLMRIAIVAELKALPLSSLISIFKGQNDFDYDTTVEQINSVKHYNRISCNRLQTDAKRFLVCNDCYLR